MLLIGNGRVVTRDAENPYLKDGAVVTEGEKILDVGTLDAMKKAYPDAEFIDAHGQIIMPGLINAHTHIYSGLARGLSIEGNNPTNFYEILDGTWWAIDRNLDLDGTRASAYATVLDCIRDGVTTIFDHHASFCEIPGSLFAIKDVCGELGIRAARFRAVSLRLRMCAENWESGPACAMRFRSVTVRRNAWRASARMRILSAGRRKRTAT